jgi:hypothetical protein
VGSLPQHWDIAVNGLEQLFTSWFICFVVPSLFSVELVELGVEFEEDVFEVVLPFRLPTSTLAMIARATTVIRLTISIIGNDFLVGRL